MNLRDLQRAIRTQTGYTLMRGVARFGAVRALVGGVHQGLQRKGVRRLLASLEPRLESSLFPGIDPAQFVARLRQDGIALGLQLPAPLVSEVLSFAADNPCFADRNPAHGFRLAQRAQAEARLAKPILLAQYFNTASECAAIQRVLRDPRLQWIAASYLGSKPTFVGVNLWWTFPVAALAADRDRHAHLFHRDVDDFRFFKYFFYLTAVEPGDGAHVCVAGSHRRPPILRSGDRWNLRRYSDAEIERYFPPQQILEVCGPAGSGFAENTMCIHKARTPSRTPRLLLQLQFGLFDYGVMHDRRDPQALQLTC